MMRDLSNFGACSSYGAQALSAFVNGGRSATGRHAGGKGDPGSGKGQRWQPYGKGGKAGKGGGKPGGNPSSKGGDKVRVQTRVTVKVSKR